MNSQRIDRTSGPFTWETYNLYLDAALASGYRFIGFDRMAGNALLPEGPFILLRHDIDYDPSWVFPVSRLEVKKGIQATYFFQTDSKFYRCHSPETRVAIEEVLAQGHWLGLHFDANAIEDDEKILDLVEEAAAELETRFATSIAAVSFHMPTRRPVQHLRLKNNRINTYSPLFFESIEYVSDSNQDWRGKDLLQLVRDGHCRRIQLLIHPIWWRETHTPFHVKIAELAAKLGIPVEDIVTAEQLALLRGDGAMTL